VVPGNDPYSIQQGVPHSTPGGIEAYAALPMELGLNMAGSAPPPFDTLSELIAAVLDQVTAYVNPGVIGPFAGRFPNLSFPEKVAVFSIMESGLAGAEVAALVTPLLTFAGLMTYSEAPALNPLTGQLLMPPVGWAICSYDGISDGRKDFKGYYKGRRAARYL